MLDKLEKWEKNKAEEESRLEDLMIRAHTQKAEAEEVIEEIVIQKNALEKLMRSGCSIQQSEEAPTTLVLDLCCEFRIYNLISCLIIMLVHQSLVYLAP